jgi:hypothetical protein
MMSLGSVFAMRASFELATFFVTWVAVVLLALIAVHLHLRLQRLERANAPGNRPVPYAHLSGRRLADLLGSATDGWQPRLVVFVSSACQSCEKILEELVAPAWEAPMALAWTNSTPSPPPRLPSNVRVLEGGERVSSALGIHATPFVLIVGEDGLVEQAMPVNSLESLRSAVGQPSGGISRPESLGMSSRRLYHESGDGRSSPD